MAGYEQKDNSGSVWHNERKRNDRDPGYTGSALIDGKEYYVSLWVNDDKRKPGKKRLSMSFNPKDDAPARASAPVDDLADDDIPF